MTILPPTKTQRKNQRVPLIIIHSQKCCFTVSPLLDPVQTTSLRIATGAFRTSPALSLCAETGIYPLHFRRLKLTANLLTKISLYPELLCYVSLFEKYGHKPSEHLRFLLNHSLAHKFKFHCIHLIASHILAWLTPTPNANLDLTEFPKRLPSQLFIRPTSVR